MSAYYFIKSKLDGNVIDIQKASTKSGALLDAYPQKTTGTDNQLWEFVPDPAGSGYYFIKSKLNGKVIDIQGASFNSKAPLDAYIHRRRPERFRKATTNSGSFCRILRALATASS